MPEFSPLPLRSLLDARPASDAFCTPIRDAVNIPVAELPDRTYELPASHTTIRIADVGEDARRTLRWLTDHGRHGEVFPYQFDTERPSAGRLWEPNEFLVNEIANLAPGLAVDLACGVGREDVFLAAHGWKVRAYDNLPDALERGRILESRSLAESGSIDWRRLDLVAARPVIDDADLITSFYFLDRGLLTWTVQAMKPRAILMIETFTAAHRERFGKPHAEKLVLRPGELAEIAAELEILHFSEGERANRRITARLMARKRG
jgi:SAM-dependent methyltransferase